MGVETIKFYFEPGKKLEARRDDLLERMINRVNKIEDAGSEYWNGIYETDSKEIVVLEQQILAGLHALVEEVGDLFSGYAASRKACNNDIIALRSVVTGEDFGDSQQQTRPDIALRTKKKAFDLSRSLRNERQRLKRVLI
ncbi:MAG: hypothetical protein JJ858_10170 [Rhizobiaceae bacterium]|nr:hypothetical protein [Rhizobiaceae bacterium]